MKDAKWNVLVVDDEEDVHAVTKIALRNAEWRGKGFELSHAYSSKEAREQFLIPGKSNLHVALIDVVMENDDAGLELCEHIRANCSTTLRIILRTGQAGLAPEEKVLKHYDIDYYLEKAEATQQKLYSIIRACLRSSEDLEKLEDANIALTVKNAELARLDQFRQAVLNNIGDPDVGAIAEILHHAQTITDVTTLPLYVRRSAAALRDAAKRIKDTFRPYEFYAHSDTVLQNKKILIMHANRNAQRLTMQALAGTSGRVSAAQNADEAIEYMRSGEADLFYVDWENIGLVHEGVKYNPNLLAILVIPKDVFEAHGPEIMDLPISSVVVTNVLGKASDRDSLTINELVVTAGKLLSGDIFGLEKYLAWGTAIREARLTSSSQRSSVIDRLDEYAQKCQLKTRARRNLQNVVDELMANAVFDAPVTSLNQKKYANRPRPDVIELTPEEMVTVRYGSDGNRFGISVTDNFGRLERDLAVSYIVRCLDDMAVDADGALGLRAAFLSVSTFIINVLAGQRTEVIGLLNMRPSRDEATRSSFHYFRRVQH